MYRYFPDKRFGDDKVAWVTWVTWKPWDLYKIHDRYALCLWATIPLREIITGHETATEYELCFASFVYPKTIDRILSMTQTWYSSYAHVFPLWLWSDMQALMKQSKKKQATSWREREVRMSDAWNISFVAAPMTYDQQLLLFPDIRTMHQRLPERLFLQTGVARWHSGLTARQQAVIFWWCKQWTLHTLISTHAGIFQDWHNLTTIYGVDMHKRRYKSQQDPRYWTPEVIQGMCMHHWCVSHISWTILGTSVF